CHLGRSAPLICHSVAVVINPVAAHLRRYLRIRTRDHDGHCEESADLECLPREVLDSLAHLTPPPGSTGPLARSHAARAQAHPAVPYAAHGTPWSRRRPPHGAARPDHPDVASAQTSDRMQWLCTSGGS